MDSGTLYLVATPIGNLSDITFRAVETLKKVSLVAAEDTRRTGQLLKRYEIQVPMTSLHEHNERFKSAELLARLKTGESIALVSDAGMPVISDPGAFLVEQAVAEVIREGRSVTYDMKADRNDKTAVGTREMGEAIIAKIQSRGAIHGARSTNPRAR